MSTKTTGKDDMKILNKIRILVDPDQTPKPRGKTIDELFLLCRKLTGVNC